MDEHDLTGPCGVLKKSTHHLILNGQKLDDQMHLEPRTSGREGGEPRSRLQPPLCSNGSFEEHPTHSSSHIPVPRNRYRPFSLFSSLLDSVSLSPSLSLSLTVSLFLALSLSFPRLHLCFFSVQHVLAPNKGSYHRLVQGHNSRERDR